MNFFRAVQAVLENPQDDDAFKIMREEFYDLAHFQTYDGSKGVELVQLIPYLLNGKYKAVAYSNDDLQDEKLIEVIWVRELYELKWTYMGRCQNGEAPTPSQLSAYRKRWVFYLEEIK